MAARAVRVARSANDLVIPENAGPNSPDYTMAKAPVIEPHQLRHALKVAAATGQNPVRDVALLLVFYSTALMPKPCVVSM
jgi:kynureninase